MQKYCFKVLAVLFLVSGVIRGLVPLNAEEALTIDENGKVGINTASPSTELDVSGDLNVSGNADIGGDATVGGIVSANNLLFSEMQEITMVMPSRSQEFDSVNLPPGFTYENTYILSSAVQAASSGAWYPILLYRDGGYIRVFLEADNKIGLLNRWENDVYPKESGFPQ